MDKALVTSSVVQTYMQLELANGTLRHYMVSDWGTAENQLRNHLAPFDVGWIATAESTVVQLSQVVEVRRVDLDDAAQQKLHNPGIPRPE